MIYFKENFPHNYLYLDIKREFKFLKSSDWFSLRKNLFTRRLTLKSLTKQTSVFLRSMSSKPNRFEKFLEKHLHLVVCRKC